MHKRGRLFYFNVPVHQCSYSDVCMSAMGYANHILLTITLQRKLATCFEIYLHLQ